MASFFLLAHLFLFSCHLVVEYFVLLVKYTWWWKKHQHTKDTIGDSRDVMREVQRCIVSVQQETVRSIHLI